MELSTIIDFDRSLPSLLKSLIKADSEMGRQLSLYNLNLKYLRSGSILSKMISA